MVNTMLDAAIEAVTETSDRLVIHANCGGGYRWPRWLSRMSEANLTCSMSRKACSVDNAACEGSLVASRTNCSILGSVIVGHFIKC